MRICSLIPSATEMIAALGLADDLVGISHECDFPPSVRSKPVMVEPLIPAHGLSQAEIDRQVGQLLAEGQRLYRLNEAGFREAEPELVISQDLCHVCAVTPDQLQATLQSLPKPAQLLTLNPASVADIIHDLERIGAAVDRVDAGRRLANQLRNRIETVQQRVRAQTHRPRVVCLEWLSPLYVAGHWVPEMVELAGGQDILATAGSPSKRVSWTDVLTAEPEILIVMPCGYSIAQTQAELAQLMSTPNQWPLPPTLANHTFLVDANAYFSRPGPRIVDGIEILAALFHPTNGSSLNESRACRLTA